MKLGYPTRVNLALVCGMLALVALGAIGAAPAAASDRHPTLEEVSKDVMCPTCGTTLERSDSPAAERMRVYIRARIADGWTRQQVVDGLVAEYGGDESILASPRRQGLGLVAWVGPLAMLLVALVGGAVVVVRWRRDGAPAQARVLNESSGSSSSSRAESSGSSSSSSSSSPPPSPPSPT